jgi:hypothetical protein
MDPHRLAELRSLAYHRVVAGRLRDDPSAIELAKRRVREWRERGVAAHYAARWEKLLDGPPDRLVQVMVADDEEARAMRQATPFAGVVGPRERWRIWDEVRRAAEAGDAR